MPRARQAVPAVRFACLALAGYTAWSYLSILWAQQQGDAWDGANRTALYAILFALFALWPIPGRAAAVLVGGFTLAIAVVGLVNLLGAAGAADPSGYFIDGRFASPAGYANADAALWSSAFWPCVVLGSRRQAAPLLRGVLIFSAVLLGARAVDGLGGRGDPDRGSPLRVGCRGRRGGRPEGQGLAGWRPPARGGAARGRRRPGGGGDRRLRRRPRQSVHGHRARLEPVQD